MTALPAAPEAPALSRPARLPAPVAGCLKAAMDALASGAWAGAMERLAGAAVVDIQQHAQAFLAGAPEAGVLCDLYARCFHGLGLSRRTRDEFPRRAGPHRIAYVMPSIAQGQGATKRLVQMLRLHDRGTFDPMVVVCDEFTRRSGGDGFVNWPDRPSRDIGRDALREIAALGVTAHTVPTEGDCAAGAEAAIRLARELDPAIAVFIASPACPIQAAMAWARVARVQINQNIAVPLPIEGIDAILYHDAACAEADGPELARRGLRALTVPGNGTDCAAADRAVPPPRSELGVPEDATVFVTAGNALPRRLLYGRFASDLARFLASHPRAWWVAIGGGDFGPVRERMAESAPGVLGRARFLGPRGDVPAVLKSCDAYLNEYPEGGCNTVLEAMACGVPALAIAAGTRHCERIGADLIGPNAPDGLDAYWRRAAEWAGDAAARRGAGKGLRARARERYDYSAVCRAYEQHYQRAALG